MTFGDLGASDQGGGAFVACLGIDPHSHGRMDLTCNGFGGASAIAFDESVAEPNDPMRVVGDIFFVSDEDYDLLQPKAQGVIIRMYDSY